MNLMSICFIVIVCWKTTHTTSSFHPITDSEIRWWRGHFNLHLAGCSASYPLSMLLVYLMQFIATLRTMLRLCFRCILHARLQDTDMQIYMVLGVGFVFLQMCSIKVNMHWKKNPWLQTVCFLSAGGSSTEKKALSQAIKLNIELHSSSCLSMPLLLMLPPKQGIKGLECGVGKSQALSLAARDICKSLCQKESERVREGGNAS